MDEDGRVVTPSKLTTQQLRAELLARGLMVEGSRREMYKRVQVCWRLSSGCVCAGSDHLVGFWDRFWSLGAPNVTAACPHCCSDA